MCELTNRHYLNMIRCELWEWHRLVTVACLILSQDSGTNYVCCHVGTVTRWQSEPRWNRDTNPGPWDQWANQRPPVDMLGQWVVPGVEITTVCFDCYQAYDLRRRSKIWVDLTTLASGIRVTRALSSCHQMYPLVHDLDNQPGHGLIIILLAGWLISLELVMSSMSRACLEIWH